MKAVVKQQARPGAVLSDLPVLKPGDVDVLVRVKATSICGTDHHIYIWNEWSQNRIKPPQIMGHEFAGEVVEVGKSVRSVKVGDYVSAETHVVCGNCIQCNLGEKHVCQNTKILGVDMDGCFADYVVVPESNIWQNDPAIPPEVASIQEPFGNAVFTVLAGETRGKTLAIFGCGAIGLMAIGVARACGASMVAAVDISDYRLKIAQAMCADLVINSRRQDPVEILLERTHGTGVDVVLEMSGAISVYSQMFRAVRAGGQVTLLGLPAKPLAVNFSDDVVMRGVTVKGITGRKVWETWLTGRELLSSGRLNLTPVITHRMKLEDFEKGMDLITSGECGKIILFP